ncbi:MAG: type II secretion system GspH family protein [Desulfobacterales bacterium]|nr:type II secretion system GspH family protein [Desulfobacterales bacterium]
MDISGRDQKERRPAVLNDGFTLLEVVIVLFILGMLAAMAWSGLGMLDNAERKKQTLETMAVIRDAIMGPSGRYDENGRRIIGGYVGDMKKFPDLWEARADVRPDFSGASWPNPGAGLGQGPDYTVNSSFVFFRPSGSFSTGEWRWNRPYRRLYDDPMDADHIGGLETENEGQPRGLWTYYTEDLPWDLPGHPRPGLTEGPLWKGPYLPAPTGRADSGSHLAKTDDAYAALEPAWDGISGNENWEDGDYNAATLGELYDDKEMFRKLNTHGRLSDAWGRALKFFITPDPDRAGSTIFWILSEGPDRDGRYPAKGTCSGHVWTVDPADTMATNYDETATENLDNIVMKIYSHEYETVFDARAQALKDTAQDQVKMVRQALAGQAPFGSNTGFTGDVGSLPRLFRWDRDADTDPYSWDDQDGATDYTKGQPRGLWTRTPNSEDAGDDIDAYAWGVGWRTRYIEPPAGILEDEFLADPWNRELLFFSDIAGQAMLILSRGPDGQFDFGSVNVEKTEPGNLTETVDVTTYDPTLPENRDNHYKILYRHEYRPGHVTIGRITVLNATVGTTRARLVRGEGTAVSQALVCTTLTDEDGDGVPDDWGQGVWPGNPCWHYDNITAEQVLTGSRKLVFWNDTDGDNEMDTGEPYTARTLNIRAVPGSGQLEEITVDTDDFLPVP